MTDRPDVDTLARQFHEAYERLAPSFGYETRTESAVPWEQVPEQNRALMRAVVEELGLSDLAARALAEETGKAYDRGFQNGIAENKRSREAAEADRDRLREALDNGDKLLSQAARRVTELEAENRRLRLYRERVEGLPEGTLAGDGGGAEHRGSCRVNYAEGVCTCGDVGGA